MKLNIRRALVLAGVVLLVVVGGSGSSGSPSGSTPSASKHSKSVQTPQRPDGVQRAVPPWGFECPTVADVLGGWSADQEDRKLLPCSMFRMPYRVADGWVTLEKGTPVVFLFQSVDWDQDHVVVALPEGFHESYRRDSGRTFNHVCNKWDVHRSPAWKWSKAFLRLGEQSYDRQKLPRGVFCGIDPS